MLKGGTCVLYKGTSPKLCVSVFCCFVVCSVLFCSLLFCSVLFCYLLFFVVLFCSLSIDRSQARNGRLCRIAAVTDIGEFASAVSIRGRGLLGWAVALHIIIMRSATSNVSQYNTV